MHHFHTHTHTHTHTHIMISRFKGADRKSTEQLLLKICSLYCMLSYQQSLTAQQLPLFHSSHPTREENKEERSFLTYKRQSIKRKRRKKDTKKLKTHASIPLGHPDIRPRDATIVERKQKRQGARGKWRNVRLAILICV